MYLNRENRKYTWGEQEIYTVQIKHAFHYLNEENRK